MLRSSAGVRQSHEVSIQSRAPPTIELINEPGLTFLPGTAEAPHDVSHIIRHHAIARRVASQRTPTYAMSDMRFFGSATRCRDSTR